MIETRQSMFYKHSGINWKSRTEESGKFTEKWNFNNTCLQNQWINNNNNLENTLR